MSPRTHLIVAFFSFALVACAESTSEPRPRGHEALFLVEQSECSTVRFHTHIVPAESPFIYHGVISGDLQGSVTLVFDAGSLEFHGATLHNSGTAQWGITSGLGSALTLFSTAFDNMNQFVDRPGSPETVIENSGRHRALSGLSRANLEYTGEFNALPSPTVELDFHGVVCQ